jgi:hypothetical protein|tara:strand:+ start:82 stop:513 length:432 start_codon:yes stop_codon:yes gene_type:complete
MAERKPRKTTTKRKKPAAKTVTKKPVVEAPLVGAAWLTQELKELDTVVRKAEAAQSFTAVANLRLRRLNVWEKLEDARKVEQVGVQMTPSEARAAIEREMDGWPDDLLEKAMDIYCERHGCAFFLSRDGDRRVERKGGAWRAV